MNECRAWGLSRERYGTWGGLSEWDRKALRRRNNHQPVNPLPDTEEIEVPGRLTGPQAIALTKRLRRRRQHIPQRVRDVANKERTDRAAMLRHSPSYGSGKKTGDQ